MNLLIFGSPIAEFPALPQIEHAFVWLDRVVEDLPEYADLQSFLEVASAEGVPVSIFSQDAGSLAEEILDQVVALERGPTDFASLCASIEPLLQGEEVACLPWIGTDSQYRLLEFLQARGVPVLDMEDGFSEMKIGETPDFDDLVQQITARVTAEVLRVVRAEIKELISSRRWRSANKKT